VRRNNEDITFGSFDSLDDTSPLSQGELEEATVDDAECGELVDLATELSSVRFAAPEPFRESLRREIEVIQQRDRAPFGRRFGGTFADAFARLRATPALGAFSMRAVYAAAGCVIAVAIAPHLSQSPAASASEILTRAEHAVTSLVSPGEVMVRKWRIVERIQERPGAPERTTTRYLLECLDGNDIRHASGRSLDASGHMYLAYVREMVNGRYTPRVYYEPGFAGEVQGLVSVVPNRHEFEAAASRFPTYERKLLTEYLGRGFGPYEPVTTELRYNESALATRADDESPMSPVRVSLEPSAALNGRAAYRVRLVEPVRLQFRWRSNGPPVVWLERRESVRYVSSKTFLTQKTEAVVHDESGRRIVSTREVVDTRIVKAPLPDHDPFALEVPAGVPVRHQSATEHLGEVVRAFERVTAFHATLAKRLIDPPQVQ
jgi:hypothetical protein